MKIQFLYIILILAFIIYFVKLFLQKNSIKAIDLAL